MAFTVSSNANTVFGNLRTVYIRATADATTQTIETGLKNILFATNMPVSVTVGVSMPTGTALGWRIYINSNASGVQSMGVLGVSNAVSGDVQDIVVFGYDA
jgi:hypothetical protein